MPSQQFTCTRREHIIQFFDFFSKLCNEVMSLKSSRLVLPPICRTFEDLTVKNPTVITYNGVKFPSLLTNFYTKYPHNLYYLSILRGNIF